MRVFVKPVCAEEDQVDNTAHIIALVARAGRVVTPPLLGANFHSHGRKWSEASATHMFLSIPDKFPLSPLNPIASPRLCLSTLLIKKEHHDVPEVSRVRMLVSTRSASATTPINMSAVSKLLPLERLFCVRAACSPLFFEHPLRNPFNHEERFRIDLDDHQLRVVTGTSEWAYLRR